MPRSATLNWERAVIWTNVLRLFSVVNRPDDATT